MKYSISQGEYAEFLNRAAKKLHYSLYNLNRFTIRHVEGKGYVADVPDRACNFFGWADILSYTAWAGLRPITDLEYEKACRGPREVARDEDAWAAGVCAPAARPRADWTPAPPASYWGIRELSLTGIPFEWPQVVRNERGSDSRGHTARERSRGRLTGRRRVHWAISLRTGMDGVI